MARYTTTGNTRSHIVHPGYQDRSRFSSRWERPAGEPSLLAGAALIAVPIIAATLLIVALS